MDNRLAVVLITILAVSAALQLQARATARKMPPTLSAGSLLPDHLSFESSCWAGFILEADCRWCKKLLADVHGDPDLHWIIVGRQPAVDSLVALYPVDKKRLRRAYWDTTGVHPLKDLNVSGVPTAIVAARQSILTASLRHSVPTADSISMMCGRPASPDNTP